MTRQPTIYEALAAKLGREPTNAECKTEVLRIMEEARAERVARSKVRKLSDPHKR